MNKDIYISNINLSVPTKTLIKNSELKLIYGSKIGLVSKNGSGKSYLLKQIATRAIPIPKQIDIFMVDQELTFDKDRSIYDIVSDANYKKIKLLEKLDKIDSEVEFEKYNKLQNKLLNLDNGKDESIIRKILFGLGFDNQDKLFSTFSGGWKMRVAIARGLYMQPHLLILDEPTNHLDLNATIWLIDYLKKWNKTLLVVSHDTYFLDQICSQIIHLDQCQLNYYNGNYNSFKKAYQLNLVTKEKQWLKIQKQKKEMQKKNVKKDIIDKFMKDNRDFEPPKNYNVKITFGDLSIIKTPYISLENVSFGYDKLLFKNITMQIDNNTKIIVVGKNGVGKSSFLQLLAGQIKNDKIKYSNNLKIGYYNQHLTDSLPLDKSPIEFLMQNNITVSEAQKYLGSIGLEGNLHHKKITSMSGGQKSRIMIANIRAMNAHVLLLDEITNHLDIETINALILAINRFNGAIIMITHNTEIIDKCDFKLLHLNDCTLSEVEYCDYYDEVLSSINI